MRRLYALVLLAFCHIAGAATIYGLTSSDGLVRFNSATPGTAVILGPVTGLGSNENVLAIDFRPKTQALYALTRNTVSGVGALYVIDRQTAVATLVAALSDGINPYVLDNARHGIDFNPVVDRLRVVNVNGKNLRIVPDTGVVIIDTPLAFAAGDDNVAATPNIVGAAYTNDYQGAKTTALYEVDSGVDVLAYLPTPNGGTLYTVGLLGADGTNLLGFDTLATSTGDVAYATMFVGGTVQLRLVDLVSGTTGVIGAIVGNNVADIAVLPDVLFRNDFE